MNRISASGFPAMSPPKVHVGFQKPSAFGRVAGELTRHQDLALHLPGGSDKLSFSGGAQSKKSSSGQAEPDDYIYSDGRSSGALSGAPSALMSVALGVIPHQIVTPATVAPPKLSLPKGKETMPQLSPRQVEISPDRRMDRVPLWGDSFKLVEYRDLERADLLPQHAINLPGLERPLLSSRLIKLDEERVGVLLYVPGPKGKYIPRPVYQSSSRGVWQAPHFILRGQHRVSGLWVTRYFGKGEKARGKMQTALEPEVQAFLSGIQRQHPPEERLDEDEINVLVGTAHNSQSPDETFDQAIHNRAFGLEELYPGSRIDSVGPKYTQARITPLSSWWFKLPQAARPNFSEPELSYGVQTKLYGPLRAEVYPSRDEQLLWTYFRQLDTGRVWVASAHLKGERMRETGLPFTLVNIGNTIPLAPYEFYGELAGLTRLPRIPGTNRVDIWRKYTSKGPLVQAYYKAKGLTCPK